MFSCLACETMYPDMCDDCLTVVNEDLTLEAMEDENLFNKFVKKLNIASGEDFPLEIMCD